MVSIGDLFVEDLELSNLMGSLGLPVSFSTSKEVSAHCTTSLSTAPQMINL
jgi:hypothetical protein